ncbi:hypothetical protein INT45_007009 [Circinella minor]|uniref:K Homology domain-containing protein n=1 Tax=Circinella minor TaxID=1195481 RepID=A0A8H7VNT1_9FUNG|nr:hypothetical protein INT45_007009 [Circinella minor]
MAATQISTAFSFCYAPPASSDYTAFIDNDYLARREATMSDLRDICNNVMSRHCCQIALTAAADTSTLASIKPQTTHVDKPTDYNLTLTGPLNTVMAARGDLLSNCPLKINLTLKIPVKDFPTTTIARKQFDKIENETETHIVIVPPPLHRSALISENRVSVVITGLPDLAEYARVRVLVALDEISNLRADILRVPLKLHNLICGRKRAGLQPIIEETTTNIYFPSPFGDLSSVEQGMDVAVVTDGGATPLLEELSPPIYITGEPVNVTRVKEMLNKLAIQKAKSMYHKDAILHARKLDWMLLHRRDELRKIMHDNGSYIAFPSIGSGMGTVTVYAENRVNAERTLRSLNFLACTIYEAYFYFNNRDSAIFGPEGKKHDFFASMTNIAGLLVQLSQASGAEVMYKDEIGCIEVFGTERDVRNVYQRVHEMAFLKVFHQNTVFNIELSNDQREFISGKKSGKINKIMKTTGAKIKFNAFSDYNFVIEVESTSVIKALDGLSMLQDELPAEISFYVPEMYHKRIIGVGGKNIQRIMKKYGVYVKFSNAEEFAALGGYYDNDDNVVARTPMKNQVNLDNLRHAVMELITQRDKDYVSQVVHIPFRMHRQLLHDQGPYFAELSKKTLTRIMWPDHELASDCVTLVGPSTEIEHAVELVQAIVPEVYELCVPRSSALTAAIGSDAFQEVVINRIERELGIRVDVQSTPIQLPPPPSVSSSSPSSSVIATTPITTTMGQSPPPLLSQQSVTINSTGTGTDSGNNNNNTNESNENAATTTAAPAVVNVRNGSQTTNSAPTSPSRSTPAPSTNGSPVVPENADFIIPLKTQKSNLGNLPAALDILIGYLRNHNVNLYETITPKTSRTTPTTATSTNHASSLSSGSLVDSFSHFGSKVLPSVSDIGSAQKMQHHNSFSSFSLFDFAPSTSASTGTTHTAFDAPWNNFRDMNSPRTVENIRAIFDSPAKHDDLNKHRMSMPVLGAQTGAPGLGVFRPPGVSSGTSSIPGADIWLPQMSPLSSSSATTSSTNNFNLAHPSGPSAFDSKPFVDNKGGRNSNNSNSASNRMFGSGGGESTLATGSFYQPYPVIGSGYSSEFHPNSTQHQPQQHHHHHHFNNICPTSSTSTGSNTSMHSTSESSAALENDLRHFSRQQQKRC